LKNAKNKYELTVLDIVTCFVTIYAMLVWLCSLM